MDFRLACVTFAGGVAVGIVTVWSLANPVTTAVVLIVCLIVLAAGAAAVANQQRRRRAAASEFDACSKTGVALRTRLFTEPVTLSPDEDRDYWWGLVNQWDLATQDVIHKQADDWHQKFYTWPISIGDYAGLAGSWRSEIIKRMDARLEALAEIRTKL